MTINNLIEEKTKDQAETETEEKTKDQAETETEEKTKDQDYDSLKKQYDTVKKQLQDSKSWGHKKNKAYIHAKKNLTDFLGKLHEEYLIADEDHQSALKFFDESDDEEIIEDNKTTNSFSKLKEKIDKEFSMYKKYNKTDQNLEKNYQSFFEFLPFFDEKEKEKVINYMANENPEVVIDDILIHGSEIYNNFFKGAEEKAGILPYLKSINKELEDLRRANKELEEELNIKTGKVSSRSIKSTNTQQSVQKSNFQDWFKKELTQSS